MKIAISANCFSAFTSGFPVRGMTLELIRMNPDVKFQLYYSRRERPKQLTEFYDEIDNLPNVEVRYYKDPHKVVAIKQMLGLKYVTFDQDVDLFLNPGHIEYMSGFRGPQICSLADLSTIKGLSTGKYAWFFKYWTKYRLKKSLPRLSQIVAISEFTRNDIRDFFPKLRTPVVVIHNGINPFWFENKDNLPSKKTPAIGVPKRPYFIWWGLISRRKNINNLIAAYRRARKSRPDLPDLLLVGKTEDYMSEIRNEFHGGIHNIPFQNDDVLKNLVAQSRGVIFPSLYEGFGLPVIEAFSQGVNVACSNVTSLPEIADGNAILFDPKDVTCISQAILDLDFRPYIGAELKHYAANFTYRQAATKYSILINRILSRKQPSQQQ